MFIFLLIFLLGFSFLIFLDIKLKNPYKLYVIIGNKGTGKTAYMTSLAYKYAKKGYNVYTNYGIFNPLKFKYWLDEYPPKSVLFIDEIGLVHDNRGFKSFPEECTEFYKYQRKNELVIYVSSQDVDFDKKIRKVADYHILLRRVLPIVFPMYYKRINKVEKQLDTGGYEIIDTLTTSLIPIRFSDVFFLNSVVKKYDTKYKVNRGGSDVA